MTFCFLLEAEFRVFIHNITNSAFVKFPEIFSTISVGVSKSSRDILENRHLLDSRSLMQDLISWTRLIIGTIEDKICYRPKAAGETRSARSFLDPVNIIRCVLPFTDLSFAFGIPLVLAQDRRDNSNQLTVRLKSKYLSLHISKNCIPTS